MIRNIVVVSDIHAGCQVAVCPPKVQFDEGGFYKRNKLQKKLYKLWLEFWNEWVPEVTRGEPYYIVVNGDIVDGKHHNSTTQISHNIKDQKNIAIMLMQPEVAKEMCKGLYMTRGTEVHVGQSGHVEDDIAKALGAIPNKENQYARYELWLKFGKDSDKLAHFTHHIGTTNSIAYESTAPRKEYVDMLVDAARWGTEIPNFLIRSHRHRAHEQKVTTRKGNCFTIVTPAWQLRTPYVYKIGGGRTTTPEVGGVILREGADGMIYSVNKIWTIDRPNAEII